MNTPKKKRFHNGSHREADLASFVRIPSRPLRSVPVRTPSNRTAEILSLVLNGRARRAPPLQHIATDRRWLTPRRAVLAAAAVVIYIAGFGYGYVVARRASVVEAEVRAMR